MPKPKYVKKDTYQAKSKNELSFNSQCSTSSIKSQQTQSYSFSYYTEKQQRRSSRPVPQRRQSLVGRTIYLALNNQDLLYVGNLHQFKSQDFNFIIRKITRDLNMLLHFKYQDFWVELQTSDSLKKSLSSCLKVLPQRIYGQYIEKAQNQFNNDDNNLQQLFKNETFLIFRQLIRIVLFIYHRMVCQSHAEQKNTIYDNWLLDVPKIFDLIGIYKESNPKILKQILKTAFESIPNYRDDVYDFAKIMVEVVLDALLTDLQFQYKQKVILDSKNFGNAKQSFTRNLVKSFFRIYDVFNLVSNFIQFFPKQYVIILMSQPCFLLELIDAYFQYCDNIQGRWQFNQQFKICFGAIIEKIRQAIIACLVRSFDFIDLTLRQPLQTQATIKCLQIYSNICEQFVKRNQSPRGQRWQSLINILISQTPHRKFFIIQPSFNKKPSKIKIKIEHIKQCQIYEQQYRKKIKNVQFDIDQKLDLKLSQIKSFKDWKTFQNFKLDVMNQQFYMDSRIYQDSLLIMLQQQIQKAGIRQKQKNINMKPLYNLPWHKNKQNKKFPYFPQEQYNDQPPELQDQYDEKYTFPLGMQRIQQIQIVEWKPPSSANQPKKQNTNVNTNTTKQNRASDNYEPYYNSPQDKNTRSSATKLQQSKLSGSNNTTSNKTYKDLLHFMKQQKQQSKSWKKKKKNYVCVSQLSIQMEPQSNPNMNSCNSSFNVVDSSSSKNSKFGSRFSNLVIQKIQIDKQQDIFKTKQQNNSSNMQNTNKNSKTVSQIKNTNKTTKSGKVDQKIQQQDQLSLSLIMGQEQQNNNVNFQDINIMDEVNNSNTSFYDDNSMKYDDKYGTQERNYDNYQNYDNVDDDYYGEDYYNYVRTVKPGNYINLSNIIEQEPEQHQETHTTQKITQKQQQTNRKNLSNYDNNISKMSQPRQKQNEFEEYSNLSIQICQRNQQQEQIKTKQQTKQKQMIIFNNQPSKKDDTEKFYSINNKDSSFNNSNLSFTSQKQSKYITQKSVNQIDNQDKEDINNNNSSFMKKQNVINKQKQKNINKNSQQKFPNSKSSKRSYTLKQQDSSKISFDKLNSSFSSEQIIRDNQDDIFNVNISEIMKNSYQQKSFSKKGKKYQNQTNYGNHTSFNLNNSNYQDSSDLSLTINNDDDQKSPKKRKQVNKNTNLNPYYTYNNPNYRNINYNTKNKNNKNYKQSQQQLRQKERQKQRQKKPQRLAQEQTQKEKEKKKKKTSYNQQW